MFLTPQNNEAMSTSLKIATLIVMLLLLATTSPAAARHVVKTPLPSSPITQTPTFKTKNSTVLWRAQATSYISVQDTTAISVVSTETPKSHADVVEPQSHVEPDASLQIAFLVLGALLALASVVVAIFFGYKQLNFMRGQLIIGRNEAHHSGSDVDLEMGSVAVPDDASDEVGAVVDPAAHNARPS